MMNKHYAPTTFTVVTSNISETIDLHKGKKIGLLVFNQKNTNPNVVYQEVLSAKGDLKEAASNLYSSLHRLDAMNLEVIISEKFPEEQWGKTINDRLKRASYQ